MSVLNRFLNHLEEWIIAFLIAAATSLIFVAVVHRYGTGAAANAADWAKPRGLMTYYAFTNGLYNWLRAIDLSWAQELCIYMFVWMAKFGAAYGVRTGIHVGVDVFVNRLCAQHRRPVIMFSLLCGALFTGIVGTLGAMFVWEIGHTSQVSADLEIPMWIVYLAVPFGSYLMCYRFLQVCVSYARTGELPHHDHSVVAGMDKLKPLEAAR